MSNDHAECLREQADDVEALDTVAAAVMGVTMRNAADEIDRLVLRLDEQTKRADDAQHECRELRATFQDIANQTGPRLTKMREERDSALLRLDSVLGMHDPWPLTDVLNKLADGVTHMLMVHGCDTHGHEEYSQARDCALELRALILSGAVERPLPKVDLEPFGVSAKRILATKARLDGE